MKRWIDDSTKFVLSIACVLLLFFFILLFIILSRPQVKIIGYWMDQNDYTVTFSEDKTCCFGNDNILSYSFIDKEHLQIHDLSGDNVSVYFFDFDNGDLLLRSSNEEDFVKYTKDSEEQKMILNRLNGGS